MSSCFLTIRRSSQCILVCVLLFSFLLSLSKLSCTNYHAYNLYRISFTLNFCCAMYYVVLEIHIGRRFLEDCFYCYSRQIIFVVAKESLIQRAQETQNLKYCNTKCHPEPNQTRKIFHTSINSRNMCKIVCKMQWFKNGFIIQLNKFN